jgi:hypothetical protein
MLSELCFESAERDEIVFSKSLGAKTFLEIKEEMYKIYPSLKLPDINKILEKVYKFLSQKEMNYDVDPALILALMTDDEVMMIYNKKKPLVEDLNHCSVAEIIPHLAGKNIDFSNPDLKWREYGCSVV